MRRGKPRGDSFPPMTGMTMSVSTNATRSPCCSSNASASLPCPAWSVSILVGQDAGQELAHGDFVLHDQHRR